MKSIFLLCGALLGAGCNEVLGLDAEFSVAGEGGESIGAAPSSGGNASEGGSPDTGGSSSEGAGGAGGGAGGGEAVEASCDDYCQAVAGSCTNANAEYMDSVCPVMCGYLPKGHVGDTSGDSIGCRLTQAALAQDDPSGHCQAAGPLGAGACSDKCEAFCGLVFATCGAAELVPYASFADCKSACDGFTYLSIDEGGSDVTTVSGDSLNCRLYHLQVAANPDIPNAVTHCNHVGAAGPCSF